MDVTKMLKIHQPSPNAQQAVGVEFKVGIGPVHGGSIATMLEAGSGLLLMVDAQGSLHVSRVGSVVEGTVVCLSMFGLAEKVPPQQREVDATFVPG